MALTEIGSPGQLAFLAAIVVATSLLLRRQIHRGRERQRQAHEPIAALSPSDSTKTADLIHAMEVRLHDSFREMQGRLESKIHVLGALLAQAEDRIARLDGLLGRPDSNRGNDAGDVPEPANPEPLVIDVDKPSRSRSLLRDEGWSEASEAERAARLADEGVPMNEISIRLGRPLAEVELMLGTRPERPLPRGMD